MEDLEGVTGAVATAVRVLAAEAVAGALPGSSTDAVAVAVALAVAEAECEAEEDAEADAVELGVESAKARPVTEATGLVPSVAVAAHVAEVERVGENEPTLRLGVEEAEVVEELVAALDAVAAALTPGEGLCEAEAELLDVSVRVARAEREGGCEPLGGSDAEDVSESRGEGEAEAHDVAEGEPVAVADERAEPLGVAEAELQPEVERERAAVALRLALPVGDPEALPVPEAVEEREPLKEGAELVGDGEGDEWADAKRVAVAVTVTVAVALMVALYDEERVVWAEAGAVKDVAAVAVPLPVAVAVPAGDGDANSDAVCMLVAVPEVEDEAEPPVGVAEAEVDAVEDALPKKEAVAAADCEAAAEPLLSCSVEEMVGDALQAIVSEGVALTDDDCEMLSEVEAQEDGDGCWLAEARVDLEALSSTDCEIVRDCVAVRTGEAVVVCEIEIVPELEEDTKGHAGRRSMTSSRRPRPICSAKKRFFS